MTMHNITSVTLKSNKITKKIESYYYHSQENLNNLVLIIINFNN